MTRNPGLNRIESALYEEQKAFYSKYRVEGEYSHKVTGGQDE